jgi:hypothetical protein
MTLYFGVYFPCVFGINGGLLEAMTFASKQGIHGSMEELTWNCFAYMLYFQTPVVILYHG